MQLSFVLRDVRWCHRTAAHSDIVAPKLPNKDGYHAGVCNLKRQDRILWRLILKPRSFSTPSTIRGRGTVCLMHFTPDQGGKPIVLKSEATRRFLLVDGAQVSSASSQQTATLSNGPIGLSSQMVVLRVSSVRILSL